MIKKEINNCLSNKLYYLISKNKADNKKQDLYCQPIVSSYHQPYSTKNQKISHYPDRLTIKTTQIL